MTRLARSCGVGALRACRAQLNAGAAKLGWNGAKAGRAVYAWRLESEFKMKSPVEISAYIRGLIGTVLVLASIGIGAGELERLKRDGVI